MLLFAGRTGRRTLLLRGANRFIIAIPAREAGIRFEFAGTDIRGRFLNLLAHFFQLLFSSRYAYRLIALQEVQREPGGMNRIDRFHS